MRRTKIIRGLTRNLPPMKEIEALEAGRGKPGRRADGCNLFARVSTARTKRAVWVFAYKRPGAKAATEITLGPVETATLEAMRARGAEMHRAWRAGKDPQDDIAAKEARKAAVRSVWAVVDKYLTDTAGKRKARTQATARGALERCLQPIADLDHETVTPHQIEDVIRSFIATRGGGTGRGAAAGCGLQAFRSGR